MSMRMAMTSRRVGASLLLLRRPARYRWQLGARLAATTSRAPPPPANAATSTSASASAEFRVDMLPALKVLAESLQRTKTSPAFQNWTPSDWLAGLLAVTHSNSRPSRSVQPAKVVTCEQTLQRLQRYVRWADAAYADSIEAFCAETQLSRECVVRVVDGGIFSPKFVLLCDHATKDIAVVARGSATILDFCTDICLVNDAFQDGQGHRGMVRAAEWLVKRSSRDLDRLAKAHPDYAITLVGHSLGGGAAALAAMLLKPRFPQVQCIGFGTPPSVTLELAQQCCEFVTTVINEDDCIPRLHERSLAHLQQEIATFDWRAALAQEVKTQTEVVKKAQDRYVEEVVATLKRLQREHPQTSAWLDAGSSAVKRTTDSLEQSTKAMLGDTLRPERLETLTRDIARRVASEWQSWQELVDTSAPALQRALAALGRSSKSEPTNKSTENERAAEDQTASSRGATARPLFDAAKEKMSDVLASAAATTSDLKTFQDAVVSKATALLQQAQQNTPSRGLLRCFHREFRIGRDNTSATGSTEPARTTASSMTVAAAAVDNLREASANTEDLFQTQLFPPGRILFLTQSSADASNTAAALWEATHDQFGRMVLSDAMLEDHLCQSYEQRLRQVAIRAASSTSENAFAA